MIPKFLFRWLSWPLPPSDPPGSSETVSSSTPERSPSPERRGLMKITMGSCNFTSPHGLQCSCTSASSISQVDCRLTGGLCNHCGHLLSLHDDYVSLPPLSALSSSSLHPDICPRLDTINKLAALLDRKRVVHVRGTPSSGKTTLAGLLARYYRQRGEPVVSIETWETVPNPREHLARQCEGNGYHNVTKDNIGDKNIVFIIDEAQSSYNDYKLWLGLIKTQTGKSSGPKICLFASYGSPSTGPPEYPWGVTPLYLGPSQRVSITKSNIPGSADISLFYSEDEFQDTVSILCSRPYTTFHMELAAREYLYSMTNGHPGAVESLVSFIFEIYRSDLKKMNIQSVTKELLVAALVDDSHVISRIQEGPVFRSFPTAKHLTVSAANVLRQVVVDGSVLYNPHDAGMKLCYEMGWLHSDHKLVDGQSNGEVVCFPPSRLHEKYFEYLLHMHEPVPFPRDKFSSLAVLCEAVIRKFSQKNLVSTVRARQTPAAFLRPPEAQFQNEWYRAFHSLLGHGVGISSEWSRGGDGRIDFRITEPAWGVELLRDGDRLGHHCGRFEKNGIYYDWISRGLIKDWLILDCRHTAPKKYNVPGTKLWRVVFDKGYKNAYILDCDNSLIVPEFPLLN